MIINTTNPKPNHY